MPYQNGQTFINAGSERLVVKSQVLSDFIGEDMITQLIVK